LIEVTSPAGKVAGLLNDSAVSCENLFTVRQDAILRKIGHLTADVMARVDQCLKASLELS
jgi:mRNA-degrading endonuclease toxin of MazEF toxin-antitoxin module